MEAPAFDLRRLHWTVIDRLVTVGRRHASHLADRAHATTPLAEHAVAFLYRPRRPSTDHGGDRTVWLAARMFTRDELLDVTNGQGDLPTVLDILSARGADFLAAGRFDPRTHMTNWRDADMRPHNADYLGVATSTLLTRSSGVRDWHTCVQLVDGLELVAGVPAIDNFYGLQGIEVRSSRALVTPGASPLTERPWRLLPEPIPDSAPARLRDALRQLHRLVVQGQLISGSARGRSSRAPVVPRPRAPRRPSPRPR